MKIIIISGIIGAIVGLSLNKISMDVRLILGISFCIGAFIGWFVKWK